MENKGNDDDENGDGCPCPVKLSDCLEELVRLTLNSHSHHLNLSSQFFSNFSRMTQRTHHLHTHNHNQTLKRLFFIWVSSNSLEGVPPYPLYKRIASALLRCMESETFCRIGGNLAMTNEFEDSSIQQKRNEWHKLIVEKGFEIENLNDGLKPIEGRCASGKYNRIKSGSLILFNKSVVMSGVRQYPTSFALLEAESLGKVLPGVESSEEGVKVYRRFYTEKEQANGVLALIELRHEGVQSLLGLMHTTGTIPSALPPPISTLLASFNLPCNPNENGLTEGAHALAKHACRSGSGYWDSLNGNNSNKNKLAMIVINRLMAYCCWLNVHTVPPHGVVFEIRVAGGYGARWTEDGSKPYMQDGHSKGWKH
uniref:ASCH domain-containing protein n=1 Tax=Glycine max TaxID=3847 RepID=K7M3K3_SOYBN